jgi:hypothetical protein
MKKLLCVFAMLGCLVGCAALKPIIRTIVDIATLLCENAASEQPISALQGQTPQQFCKVKANVQPFIDQVLSAKLNASRKTGLSR